MALSGADRLYDAIVIGGGAAGLMAASQMRGMDFLLLEGAPKVGQKLAVCGGGYANVTHKQVYAGHYLGDAGLIETVFEQFGRDWLLAFLHEHQIPLEVREGGFYFCTTPAKTLAALFERLIGRERIRTRAPVRAIAPTKEGFSIQTDQATYRSKTLLVATGGPSYPALGASGDGAVWAARLGHKVAPFLPVLVGLTLQSEQAWMKSLSGVSIPVEITIEEKKSKGNLLFAHKGISGPAVLNASLWWQKGRLTIDFLPGFDLARALDRGGAKTLLSLTPLPKSFIKAFMQSVGLEPKAVSSLSAADREKIGLLKAYALAPAGTFGLTRAEACRGGISTGEIDPKTLQSRLHQGLFFAGEVLDVTGEVGGYNLQWAFSSGALAAREIAALLSIGNQRRE